MNFADVKGLSIPSGSVKELRNAGGVLWRKSRVPAGYTEVEALIMYGGQWIDTGVTMTSEDAMSMDLTISDYTEPTFLIMGARTAFNERNITFSKQSSGYGICVDFNNGDANNYRCSVPTFQTGRYKLFASKSKRSVEGMAQNTNVNTSTFTCPSSCVVGFWGTGYGASNIGVIGLVYGAEIEGKWNGIPCYRDADGECGMWDAVNGQFHGNSGIGVIGAKYLDFPAGYTQLRAVQATGSQWIDLGLKGTQNTRIDINIRPTALDASDAQIWIGCYDGTVNFYIGPGGRQNWDIYWAPNSSNLRISFTQSTYPLLKTCQGGPSKAASTFYCFPATLSIPRQSNFTTTLNLWMFNRSSVNEQYSNLPAKATCYLARIMNSSTTVRRLVPALGNNIAGLLDLANNVFYTSITGTDLVPIMF